ncbi:MAG: aldose 1-epimerase family protein [Treponema sp.]|jgi:hypothetical protein|nr:aldose 1-epimerase family protein [Treponema sp.]
MDEKELRAHVGSMQQTAFVRPLVYTEGRAGGMKALEVNNGPLRYVVMADKCLDIADCSYRGVNLVFLSKPGLMGRSALDTHGAEARRSIMGGLFFTCGTENICPPCTDEGVEYPMHGRLRTTPAEHLCSDASWKNGEYQITVSGEMREAELFGENMVLRRKITTTLGTKTITLQDEFINNGFETQPLMLLYHFNFGYPFLREGARIIIPAQKTVLRDSGDLSRWNVMDPPAAAAGEQVFIHELRAGKNGDTFAALVNDELGIGVRLRFNKNVLPRFMEWKSTAAGDYVAGLEPANSSVFGRLEQKKTGLPQLAPFESRRIEIIIEMLDDEEIRDLDRRGLHETFTD